MFYILHGNYEGDINVPDLEELGIDNEGPLTEEQLKTVVVPDTFSDIDETVLEVFMHYLRGVGSKNCLGGPRSISFKFILYY